MKNKYFILLVFILFVFSLTAQKREEILLLHKSFEKELYTNFDNALINGLTSLELSKKINDESLQLTSYVNLARIYFLQKKNEEASKYANLAIPLAEKLNHIDSQVVLLTIKGSIQKRKGDYVETLILYEKALKKATRYNLDKRKCEIYNNLARLYWVNDNENKALLEVEKSIVLAEKNNYQKSIVDSYNIKGVLHFSKNKDSSIFYYNKALPLAQKIKNKYFEGVISYNLGDTYLGLNKFSKSLKSLHHAEKIALEINNNSSLHYINLSLGIYFEKLHKYDKAIKKYKKAIYDYGKYVDDYQRMRAYWILSGVLYHAEDFKQAYLYLEEYLELNETLFDAEKTKEFDTIRTEYEVDKKNNQITLLEKEKELESIKKNRIVYGSIVIILILILVVLVYRNRINIQKIIKKRDESVFQKETERLEQEQKLKHIQGLIEGQDKEKNRIAKELHDGVGGMLAGIKLHLFQINTVLKNNDINGVTNNLTKAFNEIRLLSHDLSTNYIKDKDLFLLLSDLKDQFELSNLFTIEYFIFPEDCLKEISFDIKHNLYRILQELFTNISKHAKAQNVSVSFTKQENILVLIVEDDGVGFNFKTISKGIGLKNVEERVLGLKGKLKVETNIDKGTHIIIETPIK